MVSLAAIELSDEFGESRKKPTVQTALQSAQAFAQKTSARRANRAGMNNPKPRSIEDSEAVSDQNFDRATLIVLLAHSHWPASRGFRVAGKDGPSSGSKSAWLATASTGLPQPHDIYTRNSNARQRCSWLCRCHSLCAELGARARVESRWRRRCCRSGHWPQAADCVPAGAEIGPAAP